MQTATVHEAAEQVSDTARPNPLSDAALRGARPQATARALRRHSQAFVESLRAAAQLEAGAMFGQLVIGPPGSGKSTYCTGMHEFLSGIGR